MNSKEDYMVKKKSRILVVDDDINVLQMLQHMLQMKGYEVITAESGEAALNMFNQISPSLVLLDLMLPGIEGIEVCRYIRRFSKIPILIVTAKGTIDEKVEGLTLGGDDYITKPFSTQELVARVAAAIRRSNFQKKTIPDMLIRFRGGLKIDLVKKIVTIHNEIIDLSSIEYRILSLLAINRDRVVTSEELLTEIWGDTLQKDVHVLQVNIGRLRSKLKDSVKGNRYIKTKPSIGYYMSF
jgi:DNA-binding response OmpR family regulator